MGTEVGVKKCRTVLSNDGKRLFQIQCQSREAEAEFVDLVSKKTHKVVLTCSPFMTGSSAVKEKNQNGTVWLGPAGKVGKGQCIARIESPLQYPELVKELDELKPPKSVDTWHGFDQVCDGKPVGKYVVSVSPGVDIALIFALAWVLDRVSAKPDYKKSVHVA